MNNQITKRSSCCNAKIIVRGKTDFYYECSKCGERCFAFFKIRKQWARNPKTQITPDNREEENNKRIKKEINENI